MSAKPRPPKPSAQDLELRIGLLRKRLASLRHTARVNEERGPLEGIRGMQRNIPEVKRISIEDG